MHTNTHTYNFKELKMKCQPLSFKVSELQKYFFFICLLSLRTFNQSSCNILNHYYMFHKQFSSIILPFSENLNYHKYGRCLCKDSEIYIIIVASSPIFFSFLFLMEREVLYSCGLKLSHLLLC